MSAPLNLLEELAQVPDPRNPKGVRHPLAAILSLAVLAMLTGAKSYTGCDLHAAQAALIAAESAEPPVPTLAVSYEAEAEPAACTSCAERSIVVYGGRRFNATSRAFGLANGNRAAYFDGTGWRPGKVIRTALHNVRARMHARQANRQARRAARGW